jgi:hypothetical protein
VWRFLTGAHMNGKKYNDSTWFKGASVRYSKRRESFTWWRRKARIKRMAWRNSCLFFTIALISALIWSISSTAIILLGFSPLVAFVLYGKARDKFWMPVVAHNNDGSVIQLWLPKPKTRKALEMIHLRKRQGRKRPGLARPEELRPGVRIEDIPLEYANAVRAEVTELDGQPPIEMKLLMDPEGLCIAVGKSQQLQPQRSPRLFSLSRSPSCRGMRR